MDSRVLYTTMLLAVLGACSGDDNHTTIDAGPRPDAPPSCPVATVPLAAGMHALYLSTEGVTIQFGDCDDSRANCSALVAQGSTVVPKFLAAEAARADRITTIASMVQDALVPFSVDVVTTRPTSGNYWMVSLGGTSDAVAGMAGIATAVKPVCDAANRNSLALVFEQDAMLNTTERQYADTIANAFGRMIGLVPSQSARDCMCGTSTCTHTQTCTWSTNAMPVPGNSCMRTTQNEQLLMMQAIGCRSS